ncbi:MULTISPECIES: electron transport complex subunit RsxG [Pseudomonas]|uniref:electron transport complex subunit RsxG n=1 Tax=Pseudomonas TaxID=286 RepID=UPI000C0F5E23|nr:electron transport complex subunit RsxG [Pseudomonadaceae bacterium]MBQ54050.1 electron transport complex subunit RsxG [Pseudomonadaceae bacterium]HCP54216.1 electron transport complex subunit RsxG [Pseudomonas sp.]
MALPEISRSMLKNSLVLGLFAIVTVGVVALTQLGTRDRIAAAERDAQARALSEILPAGSYDNHLLDNSISVFDPELLGNKTAQDAYIALKGTQPTAVILKVTAPDGYGGAIHLLVGVQASGSLAGVRALSHKETPGLGDKIDLAKSQWIRAFDGKSLSNPGADGWAVKKDRGQFDQFAGATITPRAVVKAVHKALQYVDAHKSELFAAKSSESGAN